VAELSGLASDRNRDYIANMPERDSNQEALDQVEKITDSEPVNGEDLLESPELKRQFREAKKRLEAEQSEK
jgi:hypothetical protein